MKAVNRSDPVCKPALKPHSQYVRKPILSSGERFTNIHDDARFYSWYLHGTSYVIIHSNTYSPTNGRTELTLFVLFILNEIALLNFWPLKYGSGVVPEMGRMVYRTCSHLNRYCRIRVAQTESTSVFTGKR